MTLTKEDMVAISNRFFQPTDTLIPHATPEHIPEDVLFSWRDYYINVVIDFDEPESNAEKYEGWNDSMDILYPRRAT